MTEEVKTGDNTEEYKEDERQVISTTFEGENLYAKWTPEQREARRLEIFAIAQAYAYFINRKDEFRHELASPNGGFWLTDKEQMSVLRSAVGEIISVSAIRRSHPSSIDRLVESRERKD